MKKRFVGMSIIFLFSLLVIFLYAKVLCPQKRQETFLIPEIIHESLFQISNKTEGELDFSSKDTEDGATFLSSSEEKVLSSLIEKISNPRLKEWSWEEYERPFVSYADTMNLEEYKYMYMPRPGLDNPEEIAAWGEEIIYDLVLHPGTVEEYGAVLTQTSVEAWKAFQWIYANPEDYYCYKYTHSCENDGEYFPYLTKVSIPPEYFGDLDRLYALDRTYAEGVDQELLEYIGTYHNIGLNFYWEYEKNTGLIQVGKMKYREISGTH